MTLVSIAEKLGLKRQSLSQFVSSGKLGGSKVRLLEDWLRDRGYLDVQAREEPAPYGIKMQTCPDCGQSTPMEMDGLRLLHCGHCGELLGHPCPRCGTLETRDDAQFCRACGLELTEDAAEARAIIQDAEASPAKRAIQSTEKKIAKRRERRAKGEPDI